jgi:hypothetical protein
MYDILFHRRLKKKSKQVFAVILFNLKRPRINAVYATEIDAVLAWFINAVVERVNAAGFAKPVVHVVVPPVVQGKSGFSLG